MTLPRAAAAYAILSVAMTWPIAAVATRDLPGDLGDPAFVCWVLARGSDHLLQLLGGDLSAVNRFWQAGIFHPEPSATAFSEHFLVHALLTLPVWALTRNVILCYNILFVATFALSGLGMFLLVRDLTGRPRAAFVAGLIFAFLPYRIAAVAHLQMLSSCWMPFALWGVHRFLASGQRWALAAGAAALWAQSLASGYYLVFFGPFAALFALIGLWAYRQAGWWKSWAQIAVAGAAAALATVPFALPYLRLQQRLQFRRSLPEIEGYSADLLAWFTASPWLHIWGDLDTFTRAEGWLFPGLTGSVCLAGGLVLAWRQTRSVTDGAPAARLVAVFGTIAALLAFWLALGPNPTLEGQPVGLPSLYRVLYDYAPGFGAARVPSRMAMILFLVMAMVSGVTLAFIESRRPAALVLIAVFVLAEGSAAPLPRNRVWTSAPGVLHPPEARLYPEADAPPVYRYLGTLPGDTIVAHLPFGAPEREIQYVYYNAVHGRSLVNGYSGAFPLSYHRRGAWLRDPLANLDRAAAQLADDHVSVVVVHAGAWTNGTTGAEIAEGLQQRGFSRMARFGDDIVLGSQAMWGMGSAGRPGS